MNKRIRYLIFILPLMFAIAACSSLQLPGVTAASANGNQPQQAATFSFTNQPLENKLAVGTLKLESTAQAITAEEAKNLLPLWKAVKSLNSSNTASPAEVQALYKQIEDTLTPEQVSTIKDMALTGADFQALMKQYNIQAPQGGFGNNNLTPAQRATRIAQFQAQGGGNQAGGGIPGGGRVGGGGGFPGGGNNGQASPQRTRVPGATRSGRGGMNFLFLDTLINLLQQRAGS
jgi:hypothetical protein